MKLDLSLNRTSGRWPCYASLKVVGTLLRQCFAYHTSSVHPAFVTALHSPRSTPTARVEGRPALVSAPAMPASGRDRTPEGGAGDA